jgi:hypothetical protein
LRYILTVVNKLLREVNFCRNVVVNRGDQLLDGGGAVGIQVLHDTINLEYLALEVELSSDVHALEEVQAEGVELLEPRRFFGLLVPQQALEPVELGLQLLHITICFDDPRRVLLYLSKHLHV